ncbi:DUF1735 domain-containing protein [Capnocytophaga sp.]|uniref:BT_3987 domain-containing protein n=1 Tax=Capnocytophaga sp. TaxID=44737 RepID=UPI0026DCBE70|nr:DUF1735 domain-containing protein [Capnocytophaga sp.]MDO5105117.1 DUF1735 domain-containing protein [Capnocytophaga sp.]
MNYILKIFIVLTFFFHFGCDVNMDYEGMTPGVLYLPITGVQKLTAYDVGEVFEQEIWVGKGGLSGGVSTVEMLVVPKLLDSINQSLGTSYKLLPENCYDFSNHSVNISGIANEEKFILKYYPDKILEKSNNVYDKEIFALPLRLKSNSGYKANPSKNTVFYTFTISDPVLKILNERETNVDLSATNKVSVITQFGVPFTNKWEITANIVHSEEVVENYNTTQGTFYALLPKNAYEGDDKIVLKSGENKKTLTYTINVSELTPGNYILPVQINSITSSLNGNKTDNIKYDANAKCVFVMSKKGMKISKSVWKIVSTTTEETMGEGPNNGKAIHLIDDNTDTFWHSKWQGGNSPLPYEIIIDMGKEHLVSQLDIVPRNIDNNSIGYLRFETSLDQSNWEYVGKFKFDRTIPMITCPVKSTRCRYIKLMIPEDAASTRVTSIRELTAYGE